MVPAQLDVHKGVSYILLVVQLAVPVLHIRNIPASMSTRYFKKCVSYILLVIQLAVPVLHLRNIPASMSTRC